MRSLQYATRDTDAMRQLFTDKLGFSQVYYLTDTSPPIPTEFNVATINIKDRSLNIERKQAEFRTEELVLVELVCLEPIERC